jgi:flagellar hook-associated protein 3 FlgL
MRVTQGMVANNAIRNITTSYKQMSDTQQQLSSGKKITRPSDDPVIASQGIAYRTDVSQVDQYTRNVDTANQWAQSSDSSLSEANDVLQRVRELAVQASSDTNTPDDRSAIKQEVDQLRKQLGDIANTKVGNKYIFNGTNTSTKPVTIGSDGSIKVSNGNATPGDPKNKVMVQVNQGVNLQVNVDPASFFNQQVFDDLDKLETNLTNGSDGATITGSITDIDNHLNSLAAAQSDLGARENRISLITNRLSTQQQISTNIMSNNEDADFEKTLVDYQQQQAVHTAALSVGAKIMQPTLVDFLN